MWARQKIPGTIAGLLALALLTPAARADLMAGSNIVSGNWAGGAYDANGKFSHCVVQSGYRSGITMYFSVSSNSSWRVGWSYPSWQLTVGQKVPVSVSVDGAANYQLQAVAASNVLVTAELPETADVFNQFRRGMRLNVNALGNNYTFNLDGTFAALTEIVNCANRYAGTAPPPQTNQQPSPSQTQPQSLGQPPPATTAAQKPGRFA